MHARRLVRYLVVCTTVIAAVILLTGGLVAGKATTATLGGADRYLTHLSTDKPIYRGGEKVYIRGVILHAATHSPLPGKARAPGFVEIRGPKGDIVASGYAYAADSVLGFAWPVPKGQAGGQYTIKVTHPLTGFPAAERKFDIRAYRAPRLKSQIVFLRDGYGPGDQVGATLHVERAEGGIPVGAKVVAIARVDGRQVHRGVVKVDPKGNCTARFKLPEKIEWGEGSLAMVIEDGGIVETASKTIPILLQTVDLAMYPEGGDLVAGLPARVYLEARTPAKKPADIAGIILDARGAQVAPFRTEHEGRGRFELTPEKGGKYTLKITEPAGITTTYPLPEVKEHGAVIHAVDDVTPAAQPVRLRVGCTDGGHLTVTLAKREAELSTVTWTATAGILADVTLTPPPTADGVLVATVWDAKSTPLAERLIFRQPAKGLKVAVKTERPSFVPGDTVKLTVTTTDLDGKPVGGMVGLTITDDSVLEMIEKREQAPRLPVMVFLEPEVRELADAHVYLDPTNDKAPLATDLLLGTQGWRRFAFVDAAKFLAKHGDAGRRVLALRMPSRQEVLKYYAYRRRRGGRGRGDWGDRFGVDFAKNGAKLAEGGPPRPRPAVAPARKAGPGAPDEMAGRDDDRPADKPQRGQQQGQAPAATPPPAKPQPAREPAAKEELDRDREKLNKALEAADELQEDLRLANGKQKRGLAAARALVRSSFVAVRVYAHKTRANRKPGDRVDFAETLFWHAGVKTDAKTGQATVEFALNDSVTAFRVLADAFGADGALGQSSSAVVESVEPFYIEPKLPLEVTSGDVILLPLGIVNGTPSPIPDAALVTTETDGELRVGKIAPVRLRGDARERRIIEIKVGNLNKPTPVVIRAVAGPYADKVTRSLAVKPRGFPVEVASGGVIDSESPAAKTVTIPRDVVPNSVTTAIAVYPTPLANLTEALERLIREPHGCFEQTSSTSYPLVMAQQYFLTHAGVDPKLIERGRGKLDRAYQRLVGFECKTRGYEWFGRGAAHEALTAYGLLQFSDMNQVRNVDAAMIGRTRKWLLSRRDGKGGFLRNKRALDSFGRAPEWTTNAYVVWALLEAGEKGLEREIDALYAHAGKSEDSYVVALAANIAALGGDKAGAKKFMDRLAARQAKDGHVDGAVASITRSGGNALKIEATAIATLAWLRDKAYAGNVERAIHYIAESCKAGRYGSTQSTVLALRAIVQYDKQRARPKAPGAVQVYVDDKPVGEAVKFDKDTEGAITLPDVSELLTPGEHKVEVRISDGGSMPFAFAFNYHNATPDSAKECRVGLEVALADTRIAEGAITEANVVVTNRHTDGIPMPVAIIGVPGGLEPRHDQLKELVKAGKIDAYEVIGREVVLYWREMKAGQKVRLPISMVAAVPGTYTAPASRAYLYYTDEFKTWVAGTKATIVPRARKEGL